MPVGNRQRRRDGGRGALGKLMLVPLVSGLLLGAGSGVEAVSEAVSQGPEPLEVVLVDNEGFLVVLDGRKVLVDGLFSLQERPAETVRIATEGAHPPFDDLDLILATHSHPDHFSPRAVASALRQNPRALFLGTPEAVQMMRDSVADLGPLESRITTLDLTRGERGVREWAGIRITALNSGHAGAPEVRNYMYLLERNGLKVFHEGDADAEESLGEWGLDEEGIDLAFIRLARLPDSDGMTLLGETVKARHYIPMPYSESLIQRLPPGSLALVQESPAFHLLKRSMDRVLIPPSQGEEADRAVWRAEILQLHRDAIQAHLDKDAVLLSKPISPEYLSVSEGLVRIQTPGEVEGELSDYLSRTVFSHYEDLAPPMIGVSEDGTLAWLLAQVRVAGVRETADGDPEPFDTRWAWLTLYRRDEGEWRRIADVSTNRPFGEGGSEGAIVMDAHAHPMSGSAESLRLGEKTGEIEVDFVTMKEGGLDAVFFSLPFLRRSPAASPPGSLPARILGDIESLKGEVERYGELAEMALSPEDVRRIHASGKRGVLLSIETADPFEGELGTLTRYYEAGVRMITLPREPITDPAPAGGDRRDGSLSDFGVRVVEEMNRLGILIDISHAPDALQLDIIRTSNQPVVASHSCARALNDIPREIPDAIIRALAEKGGVMAVTFSPRHISPGYPDTGVSVEDLVDHIDHIVGVVGIDHVAFGSDFLGGEEHTAGLESAAGLPSIASTLLERGYSPSDVEKVLGGNLLRLFETVQKKR